MMTDSKDSTKESVDVLEGDILNPAGFENLLNFRDVGKTINDFVGEKYIIIYNHPDTICISLTPSQTHERRTPLPLSTPR
jgi:hypothetical protein